MTQSVAFAQAGNAQARTVVEFNRAAFAVNSMTRLAVLREHPARVGKWIGGRRGSGTVSVGPVGTRCLLATTGDEDCNEGDQKQCLAKLHFQTPVVISWNSEV